jgi:hypothetical protein
MRTRAQATRDAALRRLTRLNHTLAIAALVGTGVITDVVANTASGHTRTVSESTSTVTTTATEAPARHHHHTARRAAHHKATTSSDTAATSSDTSATSSSTATVSTVQPTAVVAVSGGS